MIRVFTILIFVSIVLTTNGCGRSSNEPFTFGWETKKIFVAYVESLEFPEEIYAGEEFEVVVTLSAQMQPDVLNGRSETEGIVQLIYLYSNSDSVKLDPLPPYWNQYNQGSAYLFDRPDLTGEPRTEYTNKGVVYIPGDYVLILNAAESREYGGLQAVTDGSDYRIRPRDHVAEFEFPFTVLPAPDAGE